MPFSESVKLEAKKRSAFRCCICQRPFVEIHHILPQEEGGPDTLENAAPLCASCHDLYGGNPDKRKTIKQMRDYWWGLMSKRELNLTFEQELDEIAVVKEIVEPEGRLKSQAVALYHLVFQHENFEVSANHLVEIVKYAQKNFPNQKRILFIDIEGHRNETGGFDHDMFELQREFLISFLAPYLSEFYSPLVSAKNTKPQRNDVFDSFEVVGKINEQSVGDLMDKYEDFDLWVADKSQWLKFRKQSEASATLRE